MKPEDVKQVLKAVDEALLAYEAEAGRLSNAYDHRKSQLAGIQNRRDLNQLFRKRADEALHAMEDTHKVQLANTELLRALLQFSRNSIDSYSYEELPPDAPVGARAVEFLKLYTLIGYVHTLQTMVTISTSLRQIYQKGARSDQIPKLKEVLKVAGKIAVDEAAKYGGVDSAENIVKLVQVIADTRDAMNVSLDSLENVSDWLDCVDANDQALQDWLADVAFLVVTMESEMKRALSSCDG